MFHVCGLFVIKKLAGYPVTLMYQAIFRSSKLMALFEE